MKIEKIDNKVITENDIFKINIEKKLIPELFKEFHNGRDKLEYILSHLNILLEVDYTLDNFYVRLKSKLLNFGIGVSVNKKFNKLIFFEVSENIKKETDLFEIEFNKKFLPNVIEYLNSNIELSITEKVIKNRMSCKEYTTDYLYQKLKTQLLNTNIEISITKNVMINDIIANIFSFYNKNSKDIIEKHKKELIKEERKEEYLFKELIENNEKIDKQKEKEYRTSSIEENSKLMNYIMSDNYKEIPIENIDKELDKMDFCPYCGNVINYLDKNCSRCKILLDWE